MINFNEPLFIGSEIKYIEESIKYKHICGDGLFTKKCQKFIEAYTGAHKSLLTTSCSSALEMASLLLKIQPGDEVICPSYTFVTTASSFALRGARLVFVDIKNDTLNIDEKKIEEAITTKTKVIVPVHYAGVCAEMDYINEIAKNYNLFVVEDAAQAVGSRYKGKVAGTISDLGCYSFHETKNISCGEGGALLVNNQNLVELAEIIREKGTDRSRFFRGQVDKYTWVDLGSSYLPSDLLAAYLYPQLKNMDEINKKRIYLWNRYYSELSVLENHGVMLPFCPKYCEHNAHMFYLRFPSFELRTKFIAYMRDNGISCCFHYIPLHSSPAGEKYGRFVGSLDVTQRVASTLVRLPMYYNLDEQKHSFIIDKVLSFWK